MDIKILDNNKMKKIKAPSHNTPQTIHNGEKNIMSQSQFVVPNGRTFEYISFKNIVQGAIETIITSSNIHDNLQYKKVLAIVKEYYLCLAITPIYNIHIHYSNL